MEQLSFSVGDYVMYGSEGICRISDISSHDLHGILQCYYVLNPEKRGTGTIYVPVTSEQLLSKMKKVLTKSEAEAFLESVPDIDEEWIEPESLRKQKYRDIISSGDRTRLISMIKAVMSQQAERRKAGKKLHVSDEKFLTDGMALIKEEFSFVLSLPQDEVADMIIKIIDIH